MSEMQPPSDEPSFAHYWAWVAREKVEQEVFRLMRTTPGIVDRSHVVEDIEAATKELVACRREHLKDLSDGWEIMEKTMNREIAIKLFNEFIAGSRTLEDFERMNFAKKNKDQQGKPRSHFPAHLNGHPMLSRASIQDLQTTGVLPTTATIYSAHTAEYFEESATDKYYDLLFGDAKAFYAILAKYNPNKNMPAARAIPMPYHPNMDKQDKDFLKWFQVTQPYIPQQSMGYAPQPHPMAMSMQQMQPMPFVGYPPMGGYMPMPMPVQQMPMQGIPMQAMPMQPMQQMQPMQMQQMPQQVQQQIPQQVPQDVVYAGNSYQKNLSNGNYGGNSEQRGNNRNQRGPYKGRNSRNEQNGRYQNGNEYYEGAPSTSARGYKKQYVEAVEKPSTSQPKDVEGEEAFPALDGQTASTSLNVDVAATEAPGTSSQASAALPTPRSFSEVVSHSASASASTADISERRATVDEEEEDTSVRPSPETPSGTSDSRSVTSESVATTSDATASSSASASTGTSASVSTPASTSASSSDPSPANAPGTPAESLPSTSELVVDTSEQTVPAAPSASHKTVAEIVQQNLSAASSPSSKRVNGVSSTQPSPAVNSNTAASSPAQNGSGTAQTTPRENSTQAKANKDNRKSGKSPKKPSMSYAQMLYPKAGGSTGSPKNKQPASPSASSASASASSGPSRPSTSQNNSPAAPVLPTDWHTVKTTKKSSDPAILSPPVQTPNTERKPAPKPAPEPVVSDEDEDNVGSDDPEAEKKREMRRLKRQRQKEENRQKKQHQKELARQESLARVEQMNEESAKEKEGETKDPAPPPKPAFDRNDIAARRRRRLELQKKSEMESNGVAADPPPLLPTGMGTAPMGASIAAGQTAMTAYALNSPFRPRNSPFSLLASNGTATLPLFLPPQEGLRTNQDLYAGAVLVNDGTEKVFNPIKLVRNHDPLVPAPKKTDFDENAEMVEKLLMFDDQDKIKSLKLNKKKRDELTGKLNTIKKMHSRVERAGQLMAYKPGRTSISTDTETRLVQLSVKLLDSSSQLTATDEKLCTEIGGRIAGCSSSFNYTNYITMLVDFAGEQAETLPETNPLRSGYATIVGRTKKYMEDTKNVFNAVSKHFDMASLQDKQEEYSLLL